MITLEQIQQFQEICNLILSIPTKSGSMLGYAKAYAHTGLYLSESKYIYTQLLYISANLSTWRGKEARSTKKEIKQLLNQIWQNAQSRKEI